jgi:hypothetical protein
MPCDDPDPTTDATSTPPREPETVDGAGKRSPVEETVTLPQTHAGPSEGSDASAATTEKGPDFTAEVGRVLAALAPQRGPEELGWLGPYRILDVLGSGGMGVVFRAEDAQLKRQIAIKMMLPELALAPDNQARFLREARATAALQHDHIVPIYQVGEERGVPFIAMPLLRGKTLQDRLAEEPRVSPAEILRIGREAAEGLAAAHEHGLVHRDIKPRNMWLEAPNGRVKLLDFGLVRCADDDAGITRSGMILGTPAYMSPEQTGGRPLDHRSDLFSLGCVLYRLATGRPAFHGSDPISTLVAVASAQPTPPSELDPSVPMRLSMLIMKLLEKNPDDRPPSARTVAALLASIEKVPSSATAPHRAAAPWAPTAAKPELAGRTVHAPLETQPRQKTAGCQRAFAGCGLVTLVCVTLLVAGIVWLVVKGLPKMIDAVTEETKRQNEWAGVARVWKPPPAEAGPDRLFPESVAGVRLDRHDTEVDLRDLGIDIAGKHALYGQGAAAVDIFVFRVNALEKEALYKRVIEAPKPGEPSPPGQLNFRRSNYRAVHGTSQDQLLWYHVSPPDQMGACWWDRGWLFVARSMTGDDPEPFLRKYLTALSHGEPQK